MRVELKNGQQADSNEVMVLMALLGNLFESDRETAEDIIASARIPGHVAKSETIENWGEFFSRSDDALTPVAKDIILSAVEGEGDQMKLVDPGLKRNPEMSHVERTLLGITNPGL